MDQDYELWGDLPATPEEVYEAWLDPDRHPALRDNPPAEGFGRGRPLALEPGRRIVQAWHTVGFPEDAPESRVEVVLDAIAGGTRVTLRHSDVPSGGRQRAERGWHEYYLDPLRLYFAAPRDGHRAEDWRAEDAEAAFRDTAGEAEREGAPRERPKAGRTRR